MASEKNFLTKSVISRKEFSYSKKGCNLNFNLRIDNTSDFMRDDYTCQKCQVRGGKLNADHIKPWALYPELRYAIDNGRTPCLNCHRQTDTWGARVNFSRKVLG